jgi:hypothetical protein
MDMSSIIWWTLSDFEDLRAIHGKPQIVSEIKRHAWNNNDSFTTLTYASVKPLSNILMRGSKVNLFVWVSTRNERLWSKYWRLRICLKELRIMFSSWAPWTAPTLFESSWLFHRLRMIFFFYLILVKKSTKDLKNSILMMVQFLSDIWENIP